jgi:CMP-N-acetylneuraminic acid synthetase
MSITGAEETKRSPSVDLAVIPARGGSRRVPGKNVRPFHGKPSLAYTVAAALESRLFERVIVSTDSEEIATIARQYGAEVPFLRDAALADDHTPASLVTVDALERLDHAGNLYQHVAQLMPNCPLRSHLDIQDSYRQFLETGADSQISVMRFGWQNPWWAMRREESLNLEPIFADCVTQRSQDLPELFCPTGAIWWAKAGVLREQRTYHIRNRTGWEISWQHGVDIDTEDDWQMAELLMTLQRNSRTANVN